MHKRFIFVATSIAALFLLGSAPGKIFGAEMPQAGCPLIAGSTSNPCGGPGGGGGAPSPITGSFYLLASLVNTPYDNSWSWCTNPNFSARPGQGPGAIFGIMRANVAISSYHLPGPSAATPPYILVGFTNGNFLNTGGNGNYGADTLIPNADGTFTETFWYSSQTIPSYGTSTFSTSVQTGGYDTAWVDGVAIVTNVYQGARAQYMGAGLWETATATNYQFPNFSPASNCNGMGTYQAATSQWSGWAANISNVYTNYWRPVTSSASLAFSFQGQTPYISVYP